MPAFARLSRAATLRLREQTFMLAARLSGTRAPRILLRHVAPNILPQLVTFGLLGMGVIIIIEGALSFFGLGVPPPAPSWGNMIAEGQGVLSAEPRLVLIPSAVLFVTVLAFNLLGDALRARWSAREAARTRSTSVSRPRRAGGRPAARGSDLRVTSARRALRARRRRPRPTPSRRAGRWRSSASRAPARP